jgi:hypothetical protein
MYNRERERERERERGFLDLTDVGGLSLDIVKEFSIGNILLGEEGRETLMVGRVELGLAMLLVTGKRGLSLARGNDSDRQDNLALLAANMFKQVEATTEGLARGGEDLLERDAGEGNEIVIVSLPVEDLDKEGVLGLRVELCDDDGLFPGHIFASVGDGPGPLEVGICGGIEGNAGIGVVLAEALDIFEATGFVDGDLEFGGHGIVFGAEG